MKARAIVAWQPLLTSHFSHTLAALGAAAGLPVTVYVARRDDAVRQGQGWTDPDTNGLNVVPIPATNCVRAMRGLLTAHAGDIHIFGSPFEMPAMMRTLATALRRGEQVFLVAEPYPTQVTAYFTKPRPLDRLKALLRPLLYRGYGHLLRGRVSGVFAISAQAVTQFRAMGVAPAKIFPFGYFVPSTGARRGPGDAGAPLRIAFIGALIDRKGLPELAEAARLLRADGVAVALDVYGPGDPAAFDFAGSGIDYRGRVAFGEAQQVFAAYDLAVVPSRHDGWGVVVNEAILAGVPVICTDATGASAVVRHWGCGIVVPASDPAALAAAIAALATGRPRVKAMAARAVAAAVRLTPAVAGAYMHAAITAASTGGGLPPCPWYDMP